MKNEQFDESACNDGIERAKPLSSQIGASLEALAHCDQRYGFAFEILAAIPPELLFETLRARAAALPSEHDKFMTEGVAAPSVDENLGEISATFLLDHLERRLAVTDLLLDVTVLRQPKR